MASKRTLFGTDGIRGRANTEPMTAQVALGVAMATAVELRRGTHRNKVVIGKDTRLSGYMFEPALVSGFVSMGMDVVLLGPLPTPAVAMLTRSLRADLGVMISASHNPYYDNGIKLFGADGYKLSDEVEARIEARLSAGDFAGDLSSAAELGRASRLDDASGRYIEYVKNTFPKGARLDGLKIVVDCANGAAYKVAPRVLWELGAEVVPIAVSPDGVNINRDCGATKPLALQEMTVRHGADIGIALDGDADRLILCDEEGEIVDGDQIMALIARALAASGQLKGGAVATTVMSNLGFERFLSSIGVGIERTAVGDRYVVERMRDKGLNLGGEQSGHVILGEFGTTGDGLIAALQVLAVLAQDHVKASEACRVFRALPQILRNVTYRNAACLEAEAVCRVIDKTEKKLGSAGRVLVRKSGTEPLIRVMAEGDDEDMVSRAVQDICVTIEECDREIGGDKIAAAG